MEGRFLIYNGFKNDINACFGNLILKFNFKIKNLSDYGIDFVNDRCQLNIFYETGIQLWLRIPKYNISEMIPTLSMFKGDEIYEKYRDIVLKEMNCCTMQELSLFLIENFSEELKDNGFVPS